MDQIDLALQDAWFRVGELCRANPAEALRRFQRCRRPSVSAPVRQWCLVLRSSDTRIHSKHALIEPLANARLGPDTGSDDLVRIGLPHRVTLDAAHIRRLTEPVRIPFPGVPLWEAQKILGMSRDYVRAWLQPPNGALKITRYDPAGPYGISGKKIPIVYTPRPLDTNMQIGRAPDGVWGSLWQWKCQSLPEEFELAAIREPRFRPWRGRTVFRGWDWRCPGRLDANGESIRCGRLCQYLYLPLPPFTLAQSICAFTLEMPVGSGLKGAWQPGLQQTSIAENRRTMACKHCWGVRNPSMLKYVGWNEFVSYISGGLLYGHEVKRPEDEAPYVRKRTIRKRIKHESIKHKGARTSGAA